MEEKNKEELKKIVEALKKPFPPALVKQRVGWTDRSGREHLIDYVEWHTVADRLDEVDPEWTYSLGEPKIIGNIVSITATIHIGGIYRDGIGTGPAGDEKGIKKAESDALKRAARMFGVARDLYKDDYEDGGGVMPAPTRSNVTPIQSNPHPREVAHSGSAVDGRARDNTDLLTMKQNAAIRAIGKAQDVNIEEESQAMFGCSVDDLSRKAASAFIDHLKGGGR